MVLILFLTGIRVPVYTPALSVLHDPKTPDQADIYNKQGQKTNDNDQLNCMRRFHITIITDKQSQKT